jgi:hypothetical protein
MENQVTALFDTEVPALASPPPVLPFPRTPVSPVSGGRQGERAGMVPADDDLLQRTLAFSGSYVSDDGRVTVRRSSGELGYTAAGFIGYCSVCARSGLLPPAGEPLADVRVVIQFVAEHDHGDVD